MLSTRLGAVFLIGLLALRIGAAAKLFTVGVAAVHYPFGLDFGEGVVLNQTILLMAGHMYDPVGVDPPYVITNYPPVFHLLTGAVTHLTGNALATGRALSLLSTALSAALLAVLVWRAARDDIHPLLRGLGAMLGSVSFLAVSYTATWAPLMRVDMLAHLLALLGLVTFVATAGPGRQIYWCTLPFLLAVYTKQTAIAAPAACLLVALLVDRPLALRLGAFLLACGLASFFAADWLTDGQFYLQVIAANNNAYDWHRTAFFLSDVKQRYPVELAIGVVCAVSLLRQRPKQRECDSSLRRAPRPLSTNWTRPVLGAYVFTAFLVSLTVGKVGSEVNYLIEFMAAVCACVGIAVAEGLAGTPETTSLSASLAASVAALLLPAALVAPDLGLVRRPGIEWVEIPSPRVQGDMARLRDIIEQTAGPVLSEDLTLLWAAGKRVEFQPCDMAHMAYQGLWDQSGFVKQIRDRRYQLVILGFDVGGSAPYPDGYAPAMLAAVREFYEPVEVIANYWLYRPRQR